MINIILATMHQSYSSSSDLLVTALIIVAISALIAFAYVKSLSSKMNNIKNQTSASNYTVLNSFKLTQKHDRFLFRNVTRVPRQQNNMHGGHGGMHGGHHGGGHHGGGRR